MKINKYFKTKFGRAISLLVLIAAVSFVVAGISFVLSNNYSNKYDQISIECEESNPYGGYIPMDATEKNPEWFSRCFGVNSKLGGINKTLNSSSQIFTISIVAGFAVIFLIFLMFVGRWVYFGSKKREKN